MAKKLDIDIKQVKELAGKGYGVGVICDALGINRSTAYRNSNINNAIKTGHSQARQKVINDLMVRSESDQGATASIFLSKQLKCFDTYFPTSSPQSPSDALKKISNIYVAVAKNELPEEKAAHLISFLEKYLKAYEINNLEIRIAKLEKVAE